MALDKFITPIETSKIFNRNSSEIIIELFNVAGSKNGFSEVTARAWLNRSRNCKVKSYFPNGESDVRTDSLFRLFRNKSDKDLRQLQVLYREAGFNTINSAIDVETDDLDIFCWSLVNEFLDFLGFPRITPSHTALSKDKPIEDSLPLNTDDAEIPYKGNSSIRASILPHSDGVCCYHCENWKGNRNFGAYIEATYGCCSKYNRPEQLSSTPACKDFKKHEKSLGDFGFGQLF